MIRFKHLLGKKIQLFGLTFVSATVKDETRHQLRNRSPLTEISQLYSELSGRIMEIIELHSYKTYIHCQTGALREANFIK